MPRKRSEGKRAPNGASSIYQGSDGSWHGRVTVGLRDDGRTDRRHVRGRTETEVIRKVRDLEKARDAGTVRKPGQVWTVTTWLTHWLTNIAEPTIRPTTASYYRTAVVKYLIPGLGAHKLDRLQPEHVERFYVRLRREETGAATVQCVHRTLRNALNEALRRGRVARNVALLVKPPTAPKRKIEPFSVEEAHRILTAAADRYNGVRFAVALTLGLRKGEALGLWWRDIDFDAGILTVERALQRRVWQHGCGEDKPCGRKRGADCPHRHGGGLVVTDPKSAAGERVMNVPKPLLKALKAHRERQERFRGIAADLWVEGDWVFRQPNGKPIDPRKDHEAWKDLLKTAGVRDARLHDARHTAATMLLLLSVPDRAVMDVMGWSEMSMLTRYQHVTDPLRKGIADRLEGLLWASPPPRRSKGTRPGEGDDDGLAGALVPA